jgi:tetratricopeptide (TPR) repeat protein/tRNA A-37 threonylcarbamoyl transferase component Bud32
VRVSEESPPAALTSTQAAGSGPNAEPAGAPPEVGQRIGRYLVLSRLGAGGMGVVLAAYDPELDRKVAIKLLRAGRGGGDEGKARLLREAQAMAQLSHPNVISVFDVGTLGEQVFFAMELVVGRTLRAWQAVEGRGAREVLAVYLAAGRGLSAAHAAGLHHRDFKPENVLVGDDGRVRVLDFGLARARDDAATAARTRTGAVRALETAVPAEGSTEETGAGRLLSLQLTRDGAVLGTPAYMAPEQHLGSTTDARTDQFSFCVALWEGLCGERPFAGESVPALALAVLDGKLREDGNAARIPPWIRRLLVRGLAPDPEQRWPDMGALLAALERDPARRRRQVALGIGFAAAIAGTAAVVAYTSGPGEELCAPTRDPLAGVWDPPRRQAMESAFADTGLPYAADVWATVATTLDEYTVAAVAQQREACEAAVVRQEQSLDLMRRRHACLDRRLQEVEALGNLLLRADEGVVRKAAQAVGALLPLSHCADAEALSTGLDPPLEGERAARVQEVDAAVARGRALAQLGRVRDALPIVEQAAAQADALEHRPSQARARYQLGVLRRDAGEHAAARATLLEAARLAERAHDDRLVASALGAVVHVVGHGLARTDEALEWGEFADAALERIGDDPRVRADLESGLGAAMWKANRLGPAREHFERALALQRAAEPPDPERVAASLNNLASVAFSERHWAAAETLFAEALALRESRVGRHHPELAGLFQNLGAVKTRQNQLEEALGYFERAAEIQRAAFGADHPDYAAMVSNRGVVLLRLGRLDAAERDLRAALALRERRLGPEHDTVAASLVNIASAQVARGRPEEALADYDRAIAITRKALGDDHPQLANALASSAQLLDDLDRPRVALDRAREAERIRVKTHGADDARTLTSRGLTAWLVARVADPGDARPRREAIVQLEQVLTGLGPDDRDEAGDMRFYLAQLVAADGDDARARALAAAAAADMDAAGDRTGRAAVDAWLAAPGRPLGGARPGG